jgi:D-alanyl-lipoteichoic acid acyltransferase DltB (MBOAT superfamily)
LGLGLLFGLTRLVPPEYPYVAGWVGMTGLAFILHFGLFHVLSCAWRAAGVDARPLMNWPAAAASVSDYWGRRWNTAFRDLAHRFLFQPLATQFGPRWGLLGGFVFSGILHDLVISLPAGGGYGGPTLFFLVQGLAMLAERTRFARRLGISRGWRGWLFTMSAILLPAVLLFHPPFVLRIVVPFLQAIGAAQ